MNRVERQRDSEAQLLRASPADKPSADAPSIPDHQLLKLIASGAYGKVWLGLNAVGTPRAVKIVRRDQHTTTESFEREFKGLQKFEPASRSHEGLVDILTLGLLPDDTGFYYVMELADAISGPLVVPASAQVGAAERIEPVPEQPRLELDSYAPRTLHAELQLRRALPAEEVINLGLKLTAALPQRYGADKPSADCALLASGSQSGELHALSQNTRFELVGRRHGAYGKRRELPGSKCDHRQHLRVPD
jgi:hypothetical protein